jgi:hypothetical protein
MEEILDFEFWISNFGFRILKRMSGVRQRALLLGAPCSLFSLSHLDVLAEKFNGGTAHLIRVVICVAGDEQRAECR